VIGRGERAEAPVAAILAGGRGRRIGGEKATVELDGRPLLAYAAEVLGSVLEEVVVVAKHDTGLPSVEGIAAVWVEPEGAFHPLAGVVHALRMASGRPVLACGVDMPLLTPEVVQAVAHADPGAAPAAVPRAGGRLRPLMALYTPLALAGLSGYGPEDAPQAAVAALDPAIVEIDDADAFFEVNAPEDVLQASALRAERARVQPKVNE
jgi:molybdenum cofactor guanylyltransferase